MKLKIGLSNIFKVAEKKIDGEAHTTWVMKKISPIFLRSKWKVKPILRTLKQYATLYRTVYRLPTFIPATSWTNILHIIREMIIILIFCVYKSAASYLMFWIILLSQIGRSEEKIKKKCHFEIHFNDLSIRIRNFTTFNNLFNNLISSDISYTNQFHDIP